MTKENLPFTAAVEDVSTLSAKEKYEKYSSKDPFNNIAPALLNGADVISYANQIGMLEPFCDKQVDGVTYDVKLEGKVRYWYYDKNNNIKKSDAYIVAEGKKVNDKDIGKLKRISRLTLMPNSITYITLEPMFRMPHYIVARFNLKVNFVYKGLLLGTGPIVDPGFIGRLSIPLHNLTNNEYELFAGDALIAMEFTKISPNKSWDGTITSGTDAPQKKFSDGDFENRDVFSYTHRALENNSSSDIIVKASQYERLEKNLKNQKRQQTIQWLVIFISVAGLLFPAMSAYYNIQRERADYQKQIIKYDEEIDALSKQIELTNKIILCQNELAIEKTQKPVNQTRIDELELKLSYFIRQLNELKVGSNGGG
ncbi:hypothetical protein AGMMS50212_11660 [Spirochaetia bacterium]|nr:hypothetical protein AGMMS50212_11660 [Spirochaetia bacterium]